MGLAALAAFGCKKSEEDTTKPSITGLKLSSNITNYMAEGTVINVTADVSNLSSSDSKTALPETIGIYWMLDAQTRDTLTRDIKKSNPTYTVTVNEAGAHAIHCYAFGGDTFYNAYATISFSVVNPSTALGGIPVTGETIIAGNKYNTLVVDGKTWMGGNLYGTEAGIDYEDSQVLSSVFGRYYTWTEAQTACPDGWHLPTCEEFNALGSLASPLMVDASFINSQMWPYWPAVKITNSLSFNAIPVGYQDLTKPTPASGFKEYACFWTADEDEESPEKGVFRYIFAEKDAVMQGRGSKTSLAMSVRCVKD